MLLFIQVLLLLLSSHWSTVVEIEINMTWWCCNCQHNSGGSRQITQPHYISVNIIFDIDRDISVNIIFDIDRDISLAKNDIDRDISVNIIFSQRDISVNIKNDIDRDISVNIKNYIDRDIMRLRDLAATPWIVLAIAAPSSHIYFYFHHSGPMRRQQQEQNLYK